MMDCLRGRGFDLIPVEVDAIIDAIRFRLAFDAVDRKTYIKKIDDVNRRREVLERLAESFCRRKKSTG